MNDIFLGIIQGLTEFLPVSSSGHLFLLSKILKQKDDFAFFAFLHLATFFSVFIFTFPDIKKICKGLIKFDKKEIKLATNITLSTLPVAIIFLIFDLENLIESNLRFSLFFLCTAIMLFLSDIIIKKSSQNKKQNLYSISYKVAFLVGIAQIFTIFPGISRSGTTIFTGLLFGLNGKNSVKYSFLISLPITFAGGILKMEEIDFDIYKIFSIIFAFLSGLFGLYLLKKTVLKGKLKIFAVYCLIVSFLCLL